MVKQLGLFSLFLLMSFPITAEQPPHKKAFFAEIIDEMHALETNMQARAKEMQEKMEALFAKSADAAALASKPTAVNLSEDNEYVIVEITLPVDEVLEKGITVEAKGDNLEGSLAVKDGGNVSFFVQKGRIFGLSYTLRVTKKTEGLDSAQAQAQGNVEKQRQLHAVASTSMAEQLTLPHAVTNLEEARVTYAHNVLKLMLPKTASKNGWKKINVTH